MVVDGQGRAYVGNFGFDLMAGAPLEPTALHRVDPDGHGHRGGRRPLVPQRQRHHRRQRAPGRGDVRQPRHRVRPHRRRRARQPAGVGRVRAAAHRTRRRPSRSPSCRSPATAPASTPRVGCGSPTPSATGWSGSSRAARSPTRSSPAHRCTRAHSAAPPVRHCSPAPRPTSTRGPRKAAREARMLATQVAVPAPSVDPPRTAAQR